MTRATGIACLAVLTLLVGIAVAVADDRRAGPVQWSCFPAERWDAELGLRPCVRVVRVFEDGSVRLMVADASGRVRGSVGVGAVDR